MNKYVLHIAASVVCILAPVVGFLYEWWDSYQPKVGPVGDGKPNYYLTIPQWISMVSSFTLGIINLPLAIILYKQKINEDNKRFPKEVD
ncbi:hypothetical protein N6H13_09300 [Paenibacillus sp. CC-CFT742]|nr:hypothetical protein [Paenibacillus sp. CC-CFT742]WJH30786.1 hypothetical protein N6H13_09300 [Paenibacillus sp. CC-CFT742]